MARMSGRDLWHVGVLVSDEFVDKVVKVKRVSERLIIVKLVIGECLMNVISGWTKSG